MGLIRKTFAVGTLGVVNPSSKKQRVAKKTMKNTAATARATEQLAASAAQANLAQFSPEQTIRMQAASRHRGKIDQGLKQWGVNDRAERDMLCTQILRMVGDGATIEDAFAKAMDLRRGILTPPPSEPQALQEHTHPE